MRLKRLDYLCIWAQSAAALTSCLLRDASDLPLMPVSLALGPPGSPAARAAAYFATGHLALGTKWVLTQARLLHRAAHRACTLLMWLAQVPARMVAFPELLRSALCLLLALTWLYTAAEAPPPAAAPALAAMAAFSTLALPALVHMCHDPLFSEARLRRH